MNKISPLKAIRLKCLDCCLNQSNEVRDCTATNCPLHPFRFGKNPFTQRGKNLTDEQRKAIGERLKNSKNKEKNNCEQEK